MATVYVNGEPVDIGEERLNLIQAAMKAGVFIPHYCWHPALSVVASCRMCLVEVGETQPDGEVRMMPKVVPACQTPAKDGTVVITNSDKVRYAQQQTLESLLLNHPLDCPVCDKAGECLLQDYSYGYGRSTSRMIEDKRTPPNKPDIGDKIALFTDRCIMCSRCVRFTREISGTAELYVSHRGDHAEIDVFPGRPCNNKLAGNVVDLCPVGALANKDFLYKQRVWFLKETPSVCPDCSTGCSITIDQNKNVIYRIRPRENPQAQGYFICDEGRFGFHYVNSADRLTEPLAQKNGKLASVGWDGLITAIRRSLLEVVSAQAEKFSVVLSPYLTCEEAYLLARLFREWSPAVTLVRGYIPVIGEDDTYPKDRKGRPVEPVRFTIRAEKCPNRAGIEALITHFGAPSMDFDSFLEQVSNGEITGAFVTLGYPPRVRGWMDDCAEILGNVDYLVVQDLFPSAMAESARYVLPAASFAEKHGTFVNHAGLMQEVRPAVRLPNILRTDGQVYWELSQRKGLFHPPTVRAEMAREVPYFGAIGGQEIGEHGLRVSLPLEVEAW